MWANGFHKGLISQRPGEQRLSAHNVEPDQLAETWFWVEPEWQLRNLSNEPANQKWVAAPVCLCWFARVCACLMPDSE